MKTIIRVHKDYTNKVVSSIDIAPENHNNGLTFYAKAFGPMGPYPMVSWWSGQSNNPDELRAFARSFEQAADLLQEEQENNAQTGS